jgi:hypothetical protein
VSFIYEGSTVVVLILFLSLSTNRIQVIGQQWSNLSADLIKLTQTGKAGKYAFGTAPFELALANNWG